ncbi:Hsp20/alpha crystallin family protein [Caldimonas tepidiphila]|uniref:Hsp20/alpha crystallin family protein n=1 Tax=Caldimonas tepidiphila TaxID=2315841 RepID=UPI000E5B519C|nr:Hsp20/alpha crystallin family protein [Caldimonas tepidiphila]
MNDRQQVQTTPQDGRRQELQAKGSQPAQAQTQDSQRALLPRVDVLEDETGITLLADLPGVPRDALELRVEGDTLTIEGTIAPLTPGQLEPVYAEVRVPRYRRAFTLSRELDAERIDAQLRDGVLSLRIPKQEHAQPRRIQVQLG